VDNRRDNSIRFRYLPRIMHCFCINLLLNFIIIDEFDCECAK
jgi:hypothetical protein